MSHDEMIAVIQAHKEGTPIQAQLKRGGGPWQEFTDSLECGWDTWTWDYRIKPEPPKPRTFWLGTCHVSSNPAWKVWEYNPPRGCSQCEVICVREVLDAPSVSNGNEKV